MKRTSLFILSLFAIGCMCVSAQSANKDNFGKLLCQIIDPDTNLPVNEAFIVGIFPSGNYNRGTIPLEVEVGSMRSSSGIITTKKGYFTAKFLAGKYDLFIVPESFNKIYNKSKYCMEPFNEQTKLSFEIIKGKILKLTKKATYGGFFKIILNDMSGNRIDFKNSILSKCEIDITVTNQEINCFFSDDMEDNAKVSKALFHGIYKMVLSFKGIGFNPIIKDDVVIKPKQTTELVFMIDINDITGIEGYVRNQEGTIITNAEIYFYKISSNSTEVTQTKMTWADTNGYFHLSALPPGKYRTHIFYSKQNNRYARYSDMIDIKRNILLKKDLILNHSCPK